MSRIATVGGKKIVVHELNLREIGDFSKRYTEITEISLRFKEATADELQRVQDFFTPSMASSDEIAVQMLSAELVNEGIHESVFLQGVKDVQALMQVLPLSDDPGELVALKNTWKEVNPHFLSWSTARNVGMMITRMSRRVGLANVKKQKNNAEPQLPPGDNSGKE
jgi:hypothetical protein